MTNTATPSIAFSSSEPTGATFQCAVDAGAYASCTSPRTLATLTEGEHTFYVKATDAAGNTDATPASITFTVDLTAPDTSIDSAPATATKNTSATVTFSATEAGSTFQCQLDAGGYSTCTSSKTYSGLADGSHTISVRAIDPAGNTDATAATTTFTVDTVAPDTSVTLTTPNPTKDTSATVSFTSTQSGSTFECKLDSGSYAACTTPTTFTSLSEGAHTISVRATDTAGNTDATPASTTFTVDLTVPDTTITTTFSGGLTNTATPSIAFTTTAPTMRQRTPTTTASRTPARSARARTRATPTATMTGRTTPPRTPTATGFPMRSRITRERTPAMTTRTTTGSRTGARPRARSSPTSAACSSSARETAPR